MFVALWPVYLLRHMLTSSHSLKGFRLSSALLHMRLQASSSGSTPASVSAHIPAFMHRSCIHNFTYSRIHIHTFTHVLAFALSSPVFLHPSYFQIRNFTPPAYLAFSKLHGVATDTRQPCQLFKNQCLLSVGAMTYVTQDVQMWYVRNVSVMCGHWSK